MAWSEAHTRAALALGAELAAQKCFFAAHEAWELAWLRCDPGPLREGIRGLVQFAAAQHHRQNENFKGFAQLLQRGLDRLDRPQVLEVLNEFWPNSELAAWLQDVSTAHFPQLPRYLAPAFVLLAGGQGKRAGGPKALKILDNQLLWRWQVRQMFAAGAQQVVAILHPDCWPDAGNGGLQLSVIASDPDATQFASLQQALQILPNQDVFVLPVDCPLPPLDAVQALQFAHLHAVAHARDALAFVPTTAIGSALRMGHPAILMAEFCQNLRLLPVESARLDVELRKLGGLCVQVPVAHAAILANFNADGVSG